MRPLFNKRKTKNLPWRNKKIRKKTKEKNIKPILKKITDGGFDLRKKFKDLKIYIGQKDLKTLTNLYQYIYLR